MSLATFILIALGGLAVGVLSGAFGIGGGTMLVPLLNLACRLPILPSTATSLLVILPTALSGTARHIRQGTIDVRVGLIVGLAGMVTCTASALISERLPELVTALITATVIIYSAFVMLRQGLPRSKKQAAPPARTLTGSRRLLACLGIGLFAGLFAGIVGVGGGFVIVPFGIAWLGHTMKTMSGTSLFAVALISLPGIITHAVLGHIVYLYGLALIIGSVPGAVLGAWIITKLPERVLRLAFGVLLICSGSMILVNHIFAI
jgi:uncharacterized membrane protein YfcA